MRKTIRSSVAYSRNMLEMKMKEKNACNPLVDGHIGLEVRVIDHTLHVLCVHLDCEIHNTKNGNMNCSQSTEQPVQLKLHLQVVALNFYEANGTKVIWISFSVIPNLQRNKPDHNVRSINSQDDLVSRHVIQSTKCGGMTDCVLETLHH